MKTLEVYEQGTCYFNSCLTMTKQLDNAVKIVYYILNVTRAMPITVGCNDTVEKLHYGMWAELN